MEINTKEARPLFPMLSQSGHHTPDPMALNIQIGLMTASAVNVAVRLRLADLLETPKDIDTLAQETQTHAPSLSRLLRALAGIDIFEEIDTQKHMYVNTERSQLLRSDAMADLVTLWGASYQWDSWRDLLYTIQTGKPAMQKQNGPEATIWTYLNAHPDESRAFQRGLTINSGLIIPSILASYDFSDITTLVDMGGGHGALAVSLLQQYPQLTATLFDRASIIEQVKHGSARDLSEDIHSRYTLLAGDFFTHVPSGADAYIFKNVLMDWSDEEYLHIIQHTRQAMVERAGAGRLLVIEPVLNEESSFTNFFSVQMMMMMRAAHHRSINEHRALFEAAGFCLTMVLPLGLEHCLIEGRPQEEIAKEVAE